MNTDTKRETWKLIPISYGMYEASNLGRIRSFHRDPLRGQVLRPSLSPAGLYVFSMCVAGKRYSSTVARAVAEAFLGEPKDPRLEARHISTDLTDDRLVNIHWAYRDGTS